MHLSRAILAAAAALGAALALAAPTNLPAPSVLTVTVDTNGYIKGPTNLVAVNGIVTGIWPVVEATSNHLSVVGNRIRLVVSTNDLAGGGGSSDLQLGIASSNAFAGSWGETVSNTAGLALLAGNNASNALSGYLPLTGGDLSDRLEVSDGSTTTRVSASGFAMGDSNHSWLLQPFAGTNRWYADYGGISVLAYTIDLPTVAAGSNVTISAVTSDYQVAYTVNAQAGGGSQTPWTSTIDAGGYSLTNLAAIGSANTTNLSFTIGTNTYFIRPY